MIDQMIDANGDLVLSSNAIVQGQSKIRQDIYVRLRYIYGEWFANPKLGLPYFNILGNKESNIDIYKSYFINEISNIDNVTSCSVSSYSFKGGNLTLNFTVHTSFDTIYINFNI